MADGSLAPNSANDIKQAKLALVGLAGQNWPISNTPMFSMVPVSWGVLQNMFFFEGRGRLLQGKHLSIQKLL
jgi:hypothetical protein